jgi:hypothetical protein
MQASQEAPENPDAADMAALEAPGLKAPISGFPPSMGPALRAASQPPRAPATSWLSDRDLRLLGWICEQYAARLDHLEVLTDNRRRSAYRIAEWLREVDLVRMQWIVVGQPTWVIPTATGLSICGLPYPMWTPTLPRLVHIGAINDVRLHIQAQKRPTQWISERQLRSEASKTRTRPRHMPDGVMILEGHRVAIEVELSVKRFRNVEAHLDDLSRRFDAVLYYCAPKAHRQLTRLEQSGRWRSLGVRELPRARNWELS